MLVSKGTSFPGSPPNGASFSGSYSLSADGTKVAFHSAASNIVGGDSNSGTDVFVHDLTTKVTTRVSVSSNGIQGNAPSENACLSADGTKVAFESLASNLVSGDTANTRDIFVRDLTTRITTLVSVRINSVDDTNGSFQPRLNANGTKVAFESEASNLVNSDTNGQLDIFVRDLTNGITTRVSVSSSGAQANSFSGGASLSDDGRKIAFSSYATNLVNNDTNGISDVFVRDLTTGTTTQVSLGSNDNQYGGSGSADLSADGNKVAFASAARNILNGDTYFFSDIYVRDLTTGTIIRASVSNSGVDGNNSSGAPVLNADGSKVAFQSRASNLVSGDTNGTYDVFLHDLATGTTSRVSVSNNGSQLIRASQSPSLNGDGTRIAFESDDSNVVSGDNYFNDVFVRDLTTGVNTGVTLTSATVPEPADHGSSTSRFSFSSDGSTVAFQSQATNLVKDDTNNFTDVFVCDLATKIITRVSLRSDGTQGNGDSFNPSLSADGSKIAFQSDATNLVTGDSNFGTDIFVHDLASGITTRVSLDSNGAQGNGASVTPSLSGDGAKVAFESLASNLVMEDTNARPDIFVRDLTTGMVMRASVDNNDDEANNGSRNPSLNFNGTKVAFESDANNLVDSDTNQVTDIFLRDLSNGVTTLVSRNGSGIQGNYFSVRPGLSPDGTKLVFSSNASNLSSAATTGYYQIFVRDLTTGVTTCASVNNKGIVGNHESHTGSLSADGTKVAFDSRADNLVAADTNGSYDIFVRDLTREITVRVSVNSVGRQGLGTSFTPSLSSDGKYVAFSSTAELVGGVGGLSEVYVSDIPVFVLLDDVTVDEGNVAQGTGVRNALFTVRLSRPAGQTVTVNYSTANGTGNPAVAGSDYVATAGTLTFAPGDTIETISVPIIGDTLDEVNELFLLNLGIPQNAILSDPQVVATIADDDRSPAVSIDNVSVIEGDTGTQNATFNLTLSAPSAQTISVSAIPYNGTARATADYTAEGARVVFAPGETSKTFNVPVKGDALHEADETFFVILSSPANASIGVGRGVGTIINNDAVPSISIDDLSIGEGASGQRVAAFRLKLSAPSGQVVKVRYTTANGSALAGSDYVAVTNAEAAFATGSLFAYARVLINGDVLTEANETFLVNLSNSVNAIIDDNQAVGTVLNDDTMPSLSVNDVFITEGNAGTKTLTFTVTLSKASSQDINVNFTSADGTARSTSDYVTKSGTLNFAPGSALTRVITIIVNSDSVVENDETFYVLLNSATNAGVSKGRGMATITNDDSSG